MTGFGVLVLGLAALQTGNTVAEQWAERIQRAVQETGDSEDVGNPILDAHFESAARYAQRRPTR